MKSIYYILKLRCFIIFCLNIFSNQIKSCIIVCNKLVGYSFLMFSGRMKHILKFQYHMCWKSTLLHFGDKYGFCIFNIQRLRVLSDKMLYFTFQIRHHYIFHCIGLRFYIYLLGLNVNIASYIIRKSS